MMANEIGDTEDPNYIQEPDAGSGTTTGGSSVGNSGKVEISSDGWARPLEHSAHGMTTYDQHIGMDMPVPSGTPVYSMREGTVISTEVETVADIQRRGCPVAINGSQQNLLIESAVDGKKWTHRYAHMTSFAVKEGDKVATGALIGTSGASGCSTGAHLHVDLAVEPRRWPQDYVFIDSFWGRAPW
jgi:murein DD-endopeptidase MepM/ murein hydrolase activator NlpD